MHLRIATQDDLNDLLQFEQAVVEAERPFNQHIKAKKATYYDIPALINETNSQLLVLEERGQIIATGYIQIRPSKQSLSHKMHGYLGFMYVVPEFRGKGLNRLIMDGLIGWGKAQGIEVFYLDVYADNQAAINAYEKLGFKPSLVEMKLHC
jgi:GNAT superfamily N-acetyltransferase